MYLYELMTGTLPFPSDELRALSVCVQLRVILEREVPPPSSRVPESKVASHVFRDLDAIVLSALAKDREGRSEYLGDGVYVSYDGFGIWMTAENGMEATDSIYLEPSVLRHLNEFYQLMTVPKPEA